ncbi:hypothetical protein HPHPP3_0076 [Helicobacter pylori Hp P-3]|nr:hypothetical protein hp2017_1535 [Helicobacter pylori 2017]ADZ52264.1 hypothetical protein hp2018_1541 [Helicobacter pylori 2018]EJB82504.1 hypothetical protein HPHPH3_0077 [Helicobacter pylori Hp H-3]EJC03045.1 hypothetical protein HPHPP3_0076 [Helicobacter pylori Hp P-3]EJC54094.1 hypothetical protein HPHPP62_1670 [Helicobacter pylori Hp P-62]EJC55746.1 hypothetical protein HPHPP3B_1675 [Helicobacter pylori Hp P-3b]
MDFLDHKIIKEQINKLVKKYSTHNTFIGFNWHFVLGIIAFLKDSLMTKSYKHKEGFYVTIPKIIIIK